MGEKLLPFKGRVFIFFLLLFLLPFHSLEAQVEINWGGESFSSQAEVRVRQGKTYVNVEELFREIGGIVYYSPIMNKINLGFKGTAWVLSLDKGVAVNNGREVPLQREVFIEGNVPFVSLDLLNQLFSFVSSTYAPSITSSPEASFSPPPEEGKYPSLVLSGIRFYSYSEEMRTRVTFDFQGGIPSYSYRIDRENNRIIIELLGCNWQQSISPVRVGDGRIDRIEVAKTSEGLRINIWLQNPVQIKEEKKLPGDNPRVYFDLVSLIETRVEASPEAKSTAAPITSPKTQPTPTSPQGTPGLSYNEVNTKVVVIDPGHGGNDPGCVYNGYKEKDVVLAISQKVKAALESKGYQVFLTRSQDVYPSLNERYRVANEHRPFVFLSIHCNASPNPQATGVEVFVGGVKPRGEGAEDVAGRENQLFLEKGRAEDVNRVGNILSSAYYQGSREVSAELGGIISQKVSSTTGQKNRGLKEAPLVVLDGMYYPACLIEAGFLSNAEEAKKLASSSFQEKLAQAIAQAIDDFSRSPKFKSFLGE